MERLEFILTSIGRSFAPAIKSDGRDHLSFDLGQEFKLLGSDAGRRKFEGVAIVVPVRTQQGGWPEQVAGTVVYAHYVQLESGIAVPEEIAIRAKLPYTPYLPKRDMIAYPIHLAA
ncbi:MAG: hypothetical protein O2779_03570 [Nanoarchaeota archaeon]|nr:hypothetical protein [Nanoarchaeota archaeon]